MPISLPPVSRRRFLFNSALLAAGAVMTRSRLSFAAEAERPRRIILLSDTHIGGGSLANVLHRHCVPNLRQVVDAIRELPTRPARVLVNGDCAYYVGGREDYRQLLDLLQPIREIDVPVHLALGNHDNRVNFRMALPSIASPLLDRQITVIEEPHADLYLLDSLHVTNDDTGRLGETQLDWLARHLDARPDRAAIVFAHHPAESLDDRQNILEILSPRHQVKAFFFGHTHDWSVTRDRGDGLHLVNLPPTSYVFHSDRPLGWVDLQLTSSGAKLGLVSLDPTHPQHAEQHELTWRS